MTQKLVSIIIVSWNGLHWLKKSLPSLDRVTYQNIEIILVDNSSSDGTIEWVQKRFPQIHCLSVNNNLGYAEANNIGYETAKGDYVLFLNNDVEVTPSFITEFLHAIERDDTVAGAQSKILLLDDRKKLDTIGAFLTGTGFLYHYAFMNTDNKKFDHVIDLFTPKGACMIFKKSALEKILVEGKLFDSDAFAYFEETDMAHRIWLSGKRILYVPSSIIYHKMGGTSTTMNSAFIQYHSFKNRIASYIKNLEITSLFPMLFIHFFCCQLFAILYLFRGKINVSWAIQKAMVWNVTHVRRTLEKRVFIQRNIRKIKDKNYFKYVYKNAPLGFYTAQATGKPFTKGTLL